MASSMKTGKSRITISKEARGLLAELAAKLKVSQSEALEIVLRQENFDLSNRQWNIQQLDELRAITLDSLSDL